MRGNRDGYGLLAFTVLLPFVRRSFPRIRVSKKWTSIYSLHKYNPWDSNLEREELNLKELYLWKSWSVDSWKVDLCTRLMQETLIRRYTVILPSPNKIRFILGIWLTEFLAKDARSVLRQHTAQPGNFSICLHFCWPLLWFHCLSCPRQIGSSIHHFLVCLMVERILLSGKEIRESRNRLTGCFSCVPHSVFGGILVYIMLH
jgi:hypothetical protein